MYNYPSPGLLALAAREKSSVKSSSSRRPSYPRAHELPTGSSLTLSAPLPPVFASSLRRTGGSSVSRAKRGGILLNRHAAAATAAENESARKHARRFGNMVVRLGERHDAETKLHKIRKTHHRERRAEFQKHHRERRSHQTQIANLRAQLGAAHNNAARAHAGRFGDAVARAARAANKQSALNAMFQNAARRHRTQSIRATACEERLRLAKKALQWFVYDHTLRVEGKPPPRKPTRVLRYLAELFDPANIPTSASSAGYWWNAKETKIPLDEPTGGMMWNDAQQTYVPATLRRALTASGRPPPSTQTHYRPL